LDSLDFNRQIDRLDEQWPNTFQKQRRLLVWNEIKNKSAVGLQMVVDDILKSEKYAPLPSVLIEKMRRFRTPEEVTSFGCQLCNGSWWISHEKENTAARCPCIGGPESLLRMMEQVPDKSPRHAEVLAAIRRDIENGYYENIIKKRRIQLVLEKQAM